MPEITDIVLVAFLIGVLVAGITEVIKIPAAKKWKGAAKPTWWRVLIRTIPIMLGTLIGCPFFDAPWGLVVGGAAGVLCAVFYKKAKKLILGLRQEDLKD
jgi:uncharacterized membrane protein HdeD (DUF308 family)